MALKFAANLSLLFSDSPFLERFARARACGFNYVEFQFPYEHNTAAIAQALRDSNLKLVLHNLPPGNWSAGERGLASLPDRVDEFRESVQLALETAKVLGAPRLNCLVGKRDSSVTLDEQESVLVENLRYAAGTFQEHGIALGIEHLNPYDNPGFLMTTPSAAFRIQELVASSNLTVQYDVYHAQRTEGELANTLQKNLARIGHIQIADNPGRHEPGTGEINFPFLLNYLDGLNYSGYVGLEYNASGIAEDSFGWIREWGYSLQPISKMLELAQVDPSLD